MTLNQLCTKLSCGEPYQLKKGDPMGLRIICPEYSIHAGEVKTYPLSKQEHLFALCWCIQPDCRLHATIKPVAPAFSYSCSFSHGERTQLHTHDYIELAYVVEGSFRQRILGNDIVFGKGELCLIDKNCLHQDYLESGPSTILFLGISNKMFDEITDDSITTERIALFLQAALQKQKDLQQYLHFKPQTDINEEMEACMLFLLQELCRHDIASSYICKGLLMRIFCLLSTEYEFSLSREMRKEMNWILFESITGYIKDHYTDITIQDLTRQFHFQEDYYNRLIKAKTGFTYSGYVQHLRLLEAVRLLNTSDMKIAAIAERVGYRNKGYFYKIFTERFGVTPARFRKN